MKIFIDKRNILFLSLLFVITNIFSQIDKSKPVVLQKFHIQSKYTVLTGIVLSNISLGFGMYANYNYQFQAMNIESSHNSQLNYLNQNLALSTTIESRSIWQSDIDMENDSYNKKIKVNKDKYEINLILASFFFFAGNLMIISGLKNMTVIANGVGIVYNF